MTYWLRLLTVIAAIALPSLLPAQVVSYRGKTVGGIDIVINKVGPDATFDPNAIRAQLKTKVGEVFSQIDFDEDLKHLAGEFDRVEPEIETKESDVFITLKLWPRPTIRSITWDGNDEIKTSRLQRELGLKPGAPFDRYQFSEAFHSVKALYTKKGYFESELGYKIIPDTESNEVTIEIDVNEGRSGFIRQVKFFGFTKMEELQLIEMLQTKKFFILTSWMSGRGSYSDEAVEQDRFVVLNFLQNEGYADAKVDLQITDVPRGRGISVVFTADKGPRYKFGEFSFYGNTMFTEEQLQARLPFKKGDWYSPERMRSAVKALSDLYGEKGYIDTVVNYEPTEVAGTQTFNIQFDVKEDEQYHVGMVRVFGNCRTQERVILHESLLCPGEVFDIRRLQLTEQMLRNIGYFENVNVYCVRPNDELLTGRKYRDVYIELEEKGTGSFGVFGGISSQDGAYTGIELSESNFNYRGIPRMFSDGLSVLRGGGEFARIKLNLGNKQQQWTASWTKPYFRDTAWVIGTDLEHSTNSRQAKDYKLKNTGIKLHATYPLNVYLRIAYYYRLKYMYVDLKNQNVSTRLKREARNNGVISAASVNLIYDSIDYRHTRGIRSTLSAEYAGLGGDFNFLSFTYLNTYYRRLGQVGTVKLRGNARFIQPIWNQVADNVPIAERFFLGGETTVRGYEAYSLGPQTNGDPLGGLSSVLVSAEISRKVAQPLDIFAFVDGGYVSTGVWSWHPIRWSVGFGCRICIVNQVPIMLGMGYPLNPEDKNRVQNFFFSIGGEF